MSHEYHRIQKFAFEFNALALGACLLIGAIGCAGGGSSLPEGSGGTTDTPRVMGVCNCPDQQVACSGTCRAVNTDPQNCGKCGTVCGAGTMCLFGACLDPNSLTCTPAAQANTSPARDAFITLGKYWVNNNWWGANTGSGSNTIWS